MLLSNVILAQHCNIFAVRTTLGLKISGGLIAWHHHHVMVNRNITGRQSVLHKENRNARMQIVSRAGIKVASEYRRKTSYECKRMEDLRAKSQKTIMLD